MIDDTSTSMTSRRLNIGDPELSLLASEAAVDIDNMLVCKENKDFTALKKLATRLQNSYTIDQTSNKMQSLMDITTVTFLNDALSKTGENKLFVKLDDLLKEADRITKLLITIEQREEHNELTYVRDFCIALAKATITYRKYIRELKPVHKFRK
ncbi:MAG: hypothetical protein PHW04_10445 [Candidatus Wallbacteria bacterium]|nr:hypothetical protein [Candidatus Wallbacteria bacterium]